MNRQLSAKRLCLATASGLAMIASFAAVGSALAQDEEPARRERIVVTAEKRAADVQSVPIAVTALTSEALSAKQIESFRDLQFNVPSVTFTKGNFAGNNFQIRGIGTAAVALSGDAGIAVHTNNIYANSTVGLALAEYYDIERIEILRGPQSTLYGRNATGGAVNVITNKADLSEFGAYIEGEYGEFNNRKLRGMINIPLVEDVLAVRAAGIISQRDGFVKNVFTGNNVDDQDVYSFRGTVTLEPWEGGRIDLVGGYFHEDDTHVRSPKQMCHRDPTGVLGCLPDRLAFEPLNGNATLATILSSTQVLGPFGLFDLSAGPGLGATGFVPQDLNTINTDFEPRFRAQSQAYQAAIEQEITEWLTVHLDLGYNKGKSWSQQNYNQAVGDDISANIAVANFLASLFLPGWAAEYIPVYFASACGTSCLPISNTFANGIAGGNVLGENIIGFSSRVTAYDQIDGTGNDQSAELRFQSAFDGPFNFLAGGYYLAAESDAEYFVAANTLDYASMMLGRLLGGPPPPGSPLLLAPPIYRNLTLKYTLDSWAVFGEGYWNITDDLKLTAGLRYTKDEKRTIGQTTLFNTIMIGGNPGTDDPNPSLAAAGFDADPSTPCPPSCELYAIQDKSFDGTTGRLVIDWKPELDFTDETLVYASYAHGFRSGGMNPPLSSGLGGVAQFFAPETVDAYELGTKNTLPFIGDGVLQANATFWYYDYQDYQVSKIFNRTSVNENIGAKLWGAEGEFVYLPDDHWQFSLTMTGTDSEIGESLSIDTRNPTAGRADTVLIKSLNDASNCVLYRTTAPAGTSPADAGVPGFLNPPGGDTALAGVGVPLSNFGPCTLSAPLIAALAAAGFATSAAGGDLSGVPTQLKGNELPLTPNFTIGVGAQYIHTVQSGLDLAFRVDYYWQTETWTRIFNSDPIDKVGAWGVLNVQIQLTSDDGWNVKFFATNLLDDREITGAYLTDPSSGLFTNVFVTDPRIIGLSIGAEF